MALNLKPVASYLFFTSTVLIFLIGSHASPSPTSTTFGWKTYLKRYGYLEHARANNNGTDINEAAIKIFQENFRLKTTGILDDDTILAMNTLRCGNPDIIKGINSMQRPHNSHNSASKYNVGNTRWSSYELSYLFLKDKFPEDAKFSAEVAFSQWQANSKFIFSESQGSNGYNLTLGFFRGDHGDGWPFDGPGRVTAHAKFPPGGAAQFDADERWLFDNTKGVPKESIDFESVALHEIGHMLGLQHSSLPSAAMYPFFSPGETVKPLAQDDIDGLHYLYGK